MVANGSPIYLSKEYASQKTHFSETHYKKEQKRDLRVGVDIYCLEVVQIKEDLLAELISLTGSERKDLSLKVMK